MKRMASKQRTTPTNGMASTQPGRMSGVCVRNARKACKSRTTVKTVVSANPVIAKPDMRLIVYRAGTGYVQFDCTQPGRVFGVSE